MTKIATIKWDIRCKATSIANDFVNQPLEPVLKYARRDVVACQPVRLCRFFGPSLPGSVSSSPSNSFSL